VSTPRAAAHAALALELPTDVRVMAYARNIDRPDRDVVMLRQDGVEPHPAAPESHRRYTLTAIVVGAKVDPDGGADDNLDALLEDVLHAVESSPILGWTEARRGTWLNTTAPAYEVTVTVVHRKHPTTTEETP